MEKKTYTPAEFAAVFGKERTWAYRQLYAGKVNAITKFGQLQIPQVEVDKLLAGAERYDGSASYAKRVAKREAKKKLPVSKGAKKWRAALTQRKKHGLPALKTSLPRGGSKNSPQKRVRVGKGLMSRKSSSKRPGPEPAAETGEG